MIFFFFLQTFVATRASLHVKKFNSSNICSSKSLERDKSWLQQHYLSSAGCIAVTLYSRIYNEKMREWKLLPLWFITTFSLAVICSVFRITTVAVDGFHTFTLQHANVQQIYKEAKAYMLSHSWPPVSLWNRSSSSVSFWSFDLVERKMYPPMNSWTTLQSQLKQQKAIDTFWSNSMVTWNYIQKILMSLK